VGRSRGVRAPRRDPPADHVGRARDPRRPGRILPAAPTRTARLLAGPTRPVRRPARWSGWSCSPEGHAWPVRFPTGPAPGVPSRQVRTVGSLLGRVCADAPRWARLAWAACLLVRLGGLARRRVRCASVRPPVRVVRSAGSGLFRSVCSRPTQVNRPGQGVVGWSDV